MVLTTEEGLCAEEPLCLWMEARGGCKRQQASKQTAHTLLGALGSYWIM